MTELRSSYANVTREVSSNLSMSDLNDWKSLDQLDSYLLLCRRIEFAKKYWYAAAALPNLLVPFAAGELAERSPSKIGNSLVAISFGVAFVIVIYCF